MGKEVKRTPVERTPRCPDWCEGAVLDKGQERDYGYGEQERDRGLSETSRLNGGEVYRGENCSTYDNIRTLSGFVEFSVERDRLSKFHADGSKFLQRTFRDYGQIAFLILRSCELFSFLRNFHIFMAYSYQT
ncbi:hypothetical protein KQX54_011164 [Cotesia glomerata]|uniref:Uncharacterized protein n=1 Tax=Cotesia glomerata TaxID=32391 RepID=A0AAV7J2L3_COTGL|nr:hypothetical protein KQX54_011164 [Cotesia glomerata]